MAHFAQIDINSNEVVNVFVGRDDTVEGIDDWEIYYTIPGFYVKQTSYNTYGNQHKLGGTAFRGNYAGIGYTYDADNDVFKAPKPYASWVMDESTWTWEAPVDKPDLTDDEIAAGSYYQWNEDTTSWDLITP